MKLLISHEDYIKNEWFKIHNGTDVNGVHITGLHYFYLNYFKVEGKPNRPLGLRDSDLLFFQEMERLEKDIKYKGVIFSKRRPREYIFNQEELKQQLKKILKSNIKFTKPTIDK